MKIDESKENPVQFYNFYFSNGWGGIKLDYEVSLSSDEAFYILANILVNNESFLFTHHLQNNRLRDIEKLNLQEEILDPDKWSPRVYGPSYQLMVKFTYDYILFVKHGLLKGDLTPHFVLKYGGARLLTILGHLELVKKFFYEIKEKLRDHTQLSINQKILYCTFMHTFPLCPFLDEEIDSLYKVYPQFASIYDGLVFKQFPEYDYKSKE